MKQPNFRVIKERVSLRTDTEQEAFAQCLAINPGNPLAVAQSIKDMYETLREIKAFVAWVVLAPKEHNTSSKILRDKIEQILAKVESK